MNTQEKLEKIKSGKLTAEQNIKELLGIIKQKNKEINAFLYVDEKRALEKAKEIDQRIKNKLRMGKLAGLGIAVKANINVIGLPISCASKTLDYYYGTYDADVIKRIKAEDGIVLGITNMDEFAAGGSGEKSAFKATKNPAALNRIPGGSSSGSAAAVASGMCDLALGTDTGGSIRNPASHCGIVGIKPSYGRVSRYGVIDLAMSLDQVGPLAQDVYGAALLLGVIAGHSDSDSTTFEEAVPDYNKNLTLPKLIKLGLSPEFEKLCSNKKIYALIKKKAEELAKKIGGEIKKVQLKYTPLGVQTYYPLVYTEFFSGTRKFDGRRFGKKIEDSCGEEVLRRILGGKEISRAEFHGTYYRKALKAKELIKKDFETAFGEVDFILSPVTPELPYILGHKITPEEDYALDAFTIPANLAGICAGVVPLGRIDGLPVGLQVMGAAFAEERLIALMNAVSI
ncbi:MAG TPA: amidase family protein [Candidatus Nanoarchaeia archaeon]|nr:amidase family protein [Candidatus Nanoarchaeia archaeon]